MKNPAFAVRYSPTEKEILQASADAQGITLSSLIRNRSLNPWGTVEKAVLQPEPPSQKRNTPTTKLAPLKPLEDPNKRDYSSAYTSPSKNSQPEAPIKVNTDAYT